MNRKFFGLPLTLVFVASTAWADEYIEPTRTDLTVPEECRELGVRHFAPENITYVTYGIANAREHGFTHEYAILRDDAEWLWKSYRRGSRPEPSPRLERLGHEAQLIEQYKDPMGLDFGSEGQVLELLGLVALKSEYPEDRYFHTGGFEYHESTSSTTLGELDLLVGERESCEIVVVGEAKLGLHAIEKATEQLERFRDFLSRHRKR